MPSSAPYPSDPAQEIRIPTPALRETLEKLLVKASMFQFDATVAVSRVLEADLFGTPSHGVAKFCQLLDAIDSGDVDPRARVLSTLDLPAVTVLDGSRSLGMVAATKAVELSIPKAREQGIALALVSNSQTLGAAQVYVRMLAAANLIGLCTSSTGPATIVAPGGTTAVTGNSPFAYAIPLGDEPPLVFDSACGEESWGKLDLLRRYGLPLPDDVLLDATGQATTDWDAARTLRPAGGALGFGLSLLCSTLAGPLVGGKLPLHKKKRADADDSQHFLLAIDPARFGDPAKFQRELGQTLSEVAALPVATDSVPPRIPGRRGWDHNAVCEREGIPVHLTIADEIRSRAIKKKIPVEW